MTRPKLAAIAFLLASAAAPPALAEDQSCSPVGVIQITSLGSPEDDLSRVAELTGAVEWTPRLIRRGGAQAETVCAPADFPWAPFARPERAPAGDFALRALPVRLASTWNSTFPDGQNDGLLWAGRGFAGMFAIGADMHWGALSAAIAPEGAWSENRSFQTRPTGLPGPLAFANPYYPNAIDLPQRFGAEPYLTWAPGQSYVRADLWNVGLGLSTESLWFGPGIRSSILMSNAGPGFPHAFVGTTRPGNIGIGKAELFLFWGQLSRTEYVANGGRPLVEGLVVDYEPKWIPGLSLGLARVFVKPWKGEGIRDYLAMFQSFQKKSLASQYPGGENPYDNQIASVFGRWVFPESGLEIYGEWAREDYDWTWWGTIREPDHSQAWLLGLQKAFRTSGGKVVRLHLEALHLQEVRPLAADGGTPVYYVHGNDLFYTNAGQLLGAWVGPGGDVQHLAVDVFHKGGRIGGYLERAGRNEAYYWAFIEPVQHNWSHDVEITAAVRQVLEVGPVEVSWEAAFSYRQNRDFLDHEKNVRLGLVLSVPLTRGGAAAPPAAGTSPPAP